MNNNMGLLTFVWLTLHKVVKEHMTLKDHGTAIKEVEKHKGNTESVEGLHNLGPAQQANN